jgi:hypothetical protein
MTPMTRTPKVFGGAQTARIGPAGIRITSKIKIQAHTPPTPVFNSFNSVILLRILTIWCSESVHFCSKTFISVQLCSILFNFDSGNQEPTRTSESFRGAQPARMDAKWARLGIRIRITSKIRRGLISDTRRTCVLRRIHKRSARVSKLGGRM